MTVLVAPTPVPPTSSLLGKIPFRYECRIGTPLATAVLTPGLLKHGKGVDIKAFHVYLAHTLSSVLKVTPKQDGIRLARERVSCSAPSWAKGNRAPTPYDTTRRATQPLRLVHIDTAGPDPSSLGGSRYVVSVASWLSPQTTQLKTTSLTCEVELCSGSPPE